MTMIDALEPCPDCGSVHHKSCQKRAIFITPENTTIRCRWCLGLIYEGVPEGKKEVWAHVRTMSRKCNADGKDWPGTTKHVARPQ